MKKHLILKFNEIFGKSSEIQVFFAPGRVNLIGEHIDYSGGYVFPCAITMGTYGAVRKNNDRTLRFYSMNFEDKGMITADVDQLTYQKKDDWANYPKSVIWAIKNKGYEIEQGMDILYYGTIPNQAGLSSSASIEVLTGFIVKEIFHLDFDSEELALISQYAENDFIGVNCGIMDQFAIAEGKKDSALFLDTDRLSYEYVPIGLRGKKIVIANSNRKRCLGDSKYNDRRQECEDALLSLQKVLDIQSLCELNEDQFDEVQYAIKNPVSRKRARHAVYENQRTIRAVEALKANDLELFGQLMNESHRSLRDDYEVTGVELDTLVSSAWKQDGVLGSRMTGAGFGGCTISLVESSKVDSFIERTSMEYEKTIGYPADFYIVEVGNGPVRL